MSSTLRPFVLALALASAGVQAAELGEATVRSYIGQPLAVDIELTDLSLQDQAVQESMGRILDRRREHLGTADSGIIAVRRRLLRAVKENQDTADAAIGLTSEQQRVRSAAMVLQKSESWLRALREHLTVREGVDYTAV